MTRSARVSSLDVLRDVKAALCDFKEAASRALSEGESDIIRTISWLQNQQAANWAREVRKRTERVAEAKNELFRAQLAANDSRASCVLERKALAAAQQRLDEAERKVQNVRRWVQVLDREKLLYKAQCQQLGSAVDGDLPKALGWIDLKLQRLDEYLAVAPPPTEIRTTDGGGGEEATLRAGMPDATSIHAAVSKQRELTDFRLLRKRTPDRSVRESLPLNAPSKKRKRAEPAGLLGGALVARLGFQPDPPKPDDKVVMATGCLSQARVYLERTPAQSSDSGWFIGRTDQEINPEFEAIRVVDLLRARPAMAELLALPPGFLVVLDGDDVRAVLDTEDNNVWSG